MSLVGTKFSALVAQYTKGTTLSEERFSYYRMESQKQRMRTFDVNGDGKPDARLNETFDAQTGKVVDRQLTTYDPTGRRVDQFNEDYLTDGFTLGRTSTDTVHSQEHDT